MKIEINPSKIYSATLIFLHGLVSLAVLVSDIPWVFKLFLWVIIFPYAYFYWLKRDSVVCIEKSSIEGGPWRVYYRDSGVEQGELQGSSTLTRFWMVLIFKLEGSKKKKTVLLFPDSFSQGQQQLLYRALFVV